MNYAPIVVFVYNRANHTKKAIEALMNNLMAKNSDLYIFSDGIKQEEDIEAVKAVRQYIYSEKINQSFKKVHIIESERNKGLADSIVDGINLVLEKHNKVIVLEDDCVACPLFLKFVNEALEVYEQNKRVFSISGYAYSFVDGSRTSDDVYFCQRISSWGWGTWKDRWVEFSRDYELIRKIKRDQDGTKRLREWGPDLENMLCGNVRGEINSWAVFWALKVIELNGVCLNPYDSLIYNIGLDGSGVHCANIYENSDEISINKKSNGQFNFPQEIKISNEIQKSFQGYFDPKENPALLYNKILYKILKIKNKKIDVFSKYKDERIVIYGMGDFCGFLLTELRGVAKIVGIAVTSPKEKEFKGLKVYAPGQIPEETTLVIVIPYYDIHIIKKILEKNKTVRILGIDEIFDVEIHGEGSDHVDTH